MLVAYRLAGLSALGAHYAGVNAVTQSFITLWHKARMWRIVRAANSVGPPRFSPRDPHTATQVASLAAEAVPNGRPRRALFRSISALAFDCLAQQVATSDADLKEA